MTMRKILANVANITHLQPSSKPICYSRLPVSVTNHKITLPHDPEDCKNNFHCCELQISSHMLTYYKYICCKICSNSLVYLIYLTMKQFTAITHSFTFSSLSLCFKGFWHCNFPKHGPQTELLHYQI